MKFKELVEQTKIEQRQQNLQRIRDEIDQPWVEEKIASFCTRWGGLFDKATIKNKILHDDLLAATFAKDPSKQNVSEQLVGQILSITKLPSGGKNCVRFNAAGNIVSERTAQASKSADFQDGKWYITQKYTKESGGAQDNQYNDVYDFLLKGSQHYYVGALLDGDFWDNGKREELQSVFADNPRVKIRSVDNYNEN